MNELPSWLWAAMGGLLLMSGLFSSAETAFFSLAERDHARVGRGARRLLARPRELLGTVLLGNIVVNVLYFAFASRLIGAASGLNELIVALEVLAALLIVGEIIPKTIGLRARVTVVRATAPILVVAEMLFRPLNVPLARFLEGANRALTLWIPEETGITAEILADVMERGEEEGALLAEEADLLSEVIELDDIRVREIMTPRVDTLFVEVSGENRTVVVAEALEKRLSWLAVVNGGADQVVGRVRVRDLLRSPDRPIRQLVMPVKFVPEVASALDLLHTLREDRTTEAVVVDEWGGTAGYVTAEDVFEELVGDLRTENEPHVPPVLPLGLGRYRVAGGLSIRDWNEAFGLNVVPREFETVGGFITALLGRIPRAGDCVRAGGLELVVHEVRGRRVTLVNIGIRDSRSVPDDRQEEVRP